MYVHTYSCVCVYTTQKMCFTYFRECKYSTYTIVCAYIATYVCTVQVATPHSQNVNIVLCAAVHDTHANIPALLFC